MDDEAEVPGFSRYDQSESERERRCEAYLDPIEGEAVIRVASRPACLILTTHRVRYVDGRPGSLRAVSIMLEEIASCASISYGHPILAYGALAAGGLALIYGVLAQSFETLVLFILLAAVLLVAYARTRKRLLLLASAGDAIRLNLSGWSDEEVLDFIDDLERAKVERVAAQPRS